MSPKPETEDQKLIAELDAKTEAQLDADLLAKGLDPTRTIEAVAALVRAKKAEWEAPRRSHHGRMSRRHPRWVRTAVLECRFTPANRRNTGSKAA